MDFGKVEENQLRKIDFTLPPDPPENKIVLNQYKPGAAPKVYVGCAKWGRKDWIGKIFPPGTKEKDFLAIYASLFNSIELNATYYRMPEAAQITNWKNQVKKDFLFSPKFPEIITHIKRLKNCEEYVDRFLKAISHFEKNLGPLFLLPHPQMGLKQMDAITNFIKSIPHDVAMFTELRHPDWFRNGLDKSIYEFFGSHNRGLIITDTAGRRDCVHMYLSAPAAFIRFVGNGLHPTDYARVDNWVQRIKSWLDMGLQQCYFFMHQHEEIYSPELAKYVIRQLNKYCGLKIKEPELLSVLNFNQP